MNETKQIASSVHDYSIVFIDDFSFLKPLLDIADAIFIVDENILALYSNHLSPLKSNDRLISLNAVEENKTLAAAENIFDKIILLKPTKKTKIISIGGGITQDVSGFVASTFYRGLNWIYVPTTLLAQADSCMGSKTSLNFKSYKNILGTFYPPHVIYVCTLFTNTLSEEAFYSGMGEIAKLHIMGGTQKLNSLVSILPGIHARKIDVILSATKSSLDIKWTYMEGDEFDQGKRNMLNYGHEFGHAIETATQYSIPHGQAIVVGMILANHVALSRGYISDNLNNEISRVLFDILRVDYRVLNHIGNDLIINAMKQDKKRTSSGLPLIVMNETFEFFKILDLTVEDAVKSLEYFKNSYCQ